MDVFPRWVMSDESSNASDLSDTYNTCLGWEMVISPNAISPKVISPNVFGHFA